MYVGPSYVIPFQVVMQIRYIKFGYGHLKFVLLVCTLSLNICHCLVVVGCRSIVLVFVYQCLTLLISVVVFDDIFFRFLVILSLLINLGTNYI
jgi:hypothetical protein